MKAIKSPFKEMLEACGFAETIDVGMQIIHKPDIKMPTIRIYIDEEVYEFGPGSVELEMRPGCSILKFKIKHE